MTMKAFDLETAKILGEGIVKCMASIMAAHVPTASVLAPIIDTSKALNEKKNKSNSIGFAEIREVCQKVMPDHLAKYVEIISAATDVCLDNFDLLTNTYETKECSQNLTNSFIKQYSSQYGEAELESIRIYLPAVLECTIHELERRLEYDPDFQIKWKTAINSRIAYVEDWQKIQDKQIASYEERLTRQERKGERTAPKVAELCDIYREKWNSFLFLDNRKTLNQIYQLPNYQYHDYGSDEDVYEEEDYYSDLDEQLQSTLVYSNDVKQRMLVVLGHPGSGKSTLITYLLNKYVLPPDRKIYVYRFSGFDGIDWNKNVENIPQLMLNEMGLIKADLNNSIIILDGLDEVPMHSNHEEFLNCLYQQWAKSKEIKRFSLIVTCRRNRIGFLDDLQMRYILLCPLNEKQIEKFACAYWGKPMTELVQREKDILARINNSSKPLLGVMGIPLILYMALALEIDLSKETGLCDIYEQIFSVENEKNSIYYRRYDRKHPVTSIEAAKIHDFSKKIAELIWEFNPTEGIVEKEKYEPVSRRIANGEQEGLRELLIGQYFMEGKDGCQLLFVHRSMHEYFIALSIYDSISRVVNSAILPEELYKKVSFCGGECELTPFANLFGMQNLADYPDIQDYLLHMLQKKRLGDAKWWRSFFAEFLENGLANTAEGRTKGGLVGLNEELNRFYNLIWLTREQLRNYGETAPFLLCDNLSESIYFRIPYEGKKDLRELYLKGISLMGYDFFEAQLDKVNLTEAVLTRADFSEAELISADLRSAEMEQAVFSYACLAGAHLQNAHLKGAKFDNSILEYSDLSGADLTEVCFDNANLSHAKFSGSTLVNAKFSDAIIERTVFDGANMQGALFNGLSINASSFVSSILSKASLENVTVSPDTSMKNVCFEKCNLSYSDFRGVDLSSAEFEDAIMCEMFLRGSNLENANLYGAELSGADLEKANLKNASLREATAENSNMSEVNLENADLRGAVLTYVNLTGAKLYKTKISSNTLDNILCNSQDRQKWKVDKSIDFEQVGNNRSMAALTLDDLMEVDNDVFISRSELEKFQKLCDEYDEDNYYNDHFLQ